jgi:hypothetical protein
MGAGNRLIEKTNPDGLNISPRHFAKAKAKER